MPATAPTPIPPRRLLDAFTIKEKFPDPTGKKVLIVGDILHSRVARSTCTILKKLGVEVAYLGPGTLVPRLGAEHVRRFTDYKEAMAWSPDIVYLLRVQMERQDVQYFPSLREYHKLYGVTEARLAEIRDRGLYIMHPGPVNRGVELCDAVMDYERSLINDQVENGIAVRMAVLYWLKPGASPGDGPLEIANSNFSSTDSKRSAITVDIGRRHFVPSQTTRQRRNRPRSPRR